MFICKHLAVTVALTHCIDAPSFERQPLLPDTHALQEALGRIAPLLPAPDQSGKDPRVATLYPVAKLHKTPLGWRMITSAHGKTCIFDGPLLCCVVSVTSAPSADDRPVLKGFRVRPSHGHSTVSLTDDLHYA